MTILLVTNDRGVAERADRIVELRDGRLLAPERLDRR
jgi:predicted ABC-type transport system involved in lysophospholipase L1 biosynthesis ATPase subunit